MKTPNLSGSVAKMKAAVKKLEERIETSDELMKVIPTLGVYERMVLLMIAKRLQIGKSTYGEMREPAEDGRDWLKEASEEAFDWAVYASLHLMKLRKESSK